MWLSLCTIIAIVLFWIFAQNWPITVEHGLMQLEHRWGGIMVLALPLAMFAVMITLAITIGAIK